MARPAPGKGLRGCPWAALTRPRARNAGAPHRPQNAGKPVSPGFPAVLKGCKKAGLRLLSVGLGGVGGSGAFVLF